MKTLDQKIVVGGFLLVIAGSGCISTSSDNVTVVNVVDGDTIDIRYANGTEERVRLIGVDTPEVYGSNSPEEFGFNDTEEMRECIGGYGDNASDFMSKFEGNAVRILQDSIQDKRGGYGRLLGYVYVDNRSISVNQILLEKGLARVYYSEFSQRNAFIESERVAKSTNSGLWSCS